MSTRFNQIVGQLSGASRSRVILAMAVVWAGLMVAPPALGQAQSDSDLGAPEADTFVIRVSFSPGFGQESADAVCEILKREVSFWQLQAQGSRTPGNGHPVSDWTDRVHVNVLRIVIAILAWATLIAILRLGIRWVADVRRIPKYNANKGTVLLTWRLGQYGIVVTSLLVVWPLMIGVVTYQPGAPATELAQEPPRPSAPSGPLAVRVDGPQESQEGLATSVLTCPRQEPDTMRLGSHIVSTLDIYGLGEIKVVSVPQGTADAPDAKRHLTLHLYTPPHLDLQVRREPGERVEKMLDDLREKIPYLKILPSGGPDKEAQQCTLHYAQSNPLGRVLAEQMSDVLTEHGLAPENIDASTLLEPRVIVLVIPSVPETQLVLHHLPAQDIGALTACLRQEGVAVTDRPSDNPPIAPGVLYYPVSDGAGAALAAREKADKILQLAHDQGFLGSSAPSGWGIPAGREGNDAYELSLIPIKGSQDVDILCDRDFDSKLRPIVTTVLDSADCAMNARFSASRETPLGEPGVIRYPHAEDAVWAERLRALLTERVGLVNLRVAEAQEPQLERMFVWLRYDKNGLFHRFVSHLLDSIENGARDDLRSQFTDRGWQEDRATRVEYAPSCAKTLAYRADDFDRDWTERFVRPWTFRLATWRLQREQGVAAWYSVVPAQRTLVCSETAAGIRVDAAPEVDDLEPPERFDVVVTEGGREIQDILRKYDSKVDMVPPPAGSVQRTIYFPQGVPEAEAVARMTQAILRDAGRIFDIEPYGPQEGDGRIVVADATKEGP